MEVVETFKREQFTFYRSYQAALKRLNKQSRLVMYEAIIAYGLDGTEPQGLTPVQQGIFELARPHMASGRKKALKAVRRRADEELRDLMVYHPDTED